MGFLATIFGASASQPVSSESVLPTLLRITRTHSGVVVNEVTAMGVPAVYAAIGVIADAIAQLPLDVRRRRPDGGSEAATDHPAYRMLRGEPNEYMTSFVFRNTVTSHAVGWGNGYAHIERNGRGQAVRLWPLLPDRTRPEKRTDGEVRIVTSIDGTWYSLPHRDVVHIPALGFDGLQGYSPIAMFRESLGLAIATQEFGARFFSNEATSGGYIEVPPGTTPDGLRILREAWNAQGGIGSAHRTKVLPDGAKFHPTTINPDDAQFLQTRQFQISEIARIFRVPLHMLASHEGASVWGTGIEHMSLGFVRYTLAPWIARWEQELNRKLFTDMEREEGYYVKFNLNSLLRGDANSRANFYNAAISGGWMEPSEARELEDMEPIPGLDERPRALPGAAPIPGSPRQRDQEE